MRGTRQQGPKEVRPRKTLAVVESESSHGVESYIGRPTPEWFSGLARSSKPAHPVGPGKFRSRLWFNKQFASSFSP